MSINAQPFQPQFKLIGNLAEDQVLVYDVSEGAFVNSAGSGGGGASGFTTIQNMGATGTAIHYGEAGTTLQLKKIIGGDNLTITDNGTGGLILAATNTDTIQDGTNLGTGTAIFSSKDAGTHALQFKSIVAGAGLTLTDDGAGTLTLVNDIAAGTTDADLTLSNLSNVVTARTNLEVYSKAEGDARYHDKFSNFLPSTNNVYDIGSPSFKFNDIYAETFQGTAVLADQLTISGTSGQVLTHNGSSWVAADSSGGGTLNSASDMSNVAPANGQHLVWDAGTSLWTPGASGSGGGGYQDSDARGAISVAGDLSYNSSTGVITFSQNDAWSNITGTPTTLAGYGITDGGGSVTPSSTDTFTNKSGAISQWTNDSNYLTTVPAQTFASLTSKPTTLAGYGITDALALGTSSTTALAGNTVIPTAVSQLTNDSSFLTSVPAQTFASLTSKPTTLAGYGITDGGGSYTNSNVDGHLNVSGASANQILKWTGTDYAWVTSTDSDTTYTAGSGLTLTGTVFSLTAGHFDGAYGSLTGAPTTVSSFTNDAGYLTSETDSQTLSLSGTTLSISTGNNVDLGGLTIDDFADVNITSVSDGQFLTYNNGSGEWTNSTVSIPTLTSQLTNDAGFITSASTYDNSDVDTHLNQSNPTSGYVLSWNGSDYAWVSNGASGAHYTDSDARAAFSATTGLSYNSGTGVFSLNSELSGLSNVSSSAPTSGQVLKWNGSAWAPAADVDTDTVYTTFTSDFDTRLATKSTANLGEDASNKYFTDARARAAISATGSLSYNASTGVISYTAPTMYANSDVDTHLNSGSATSGQILSWTGTDYDWILNDNNTPAWSAITSKPTTIAGFGITDAKIIPFYYANQAAFPNASTNHGAIAHSHSDGAMYFAHGGSWNKLANNATTLAGYGITDAITASSSTAFTNKTGNISQWTNDSGFITSVPAQTFASLTGKPTSIAGYGITDAFDGAFGSLSGKPTTIAGYGITDAVTPSSSTAFTNKSGNISQWTNDTGFLTSVPAQTFSSLTSKPTTIAGYGITDANTYANGDVDSHLNQSNPTSGYVLSWNGSDYSWVAQSGGGSVTATSSTAFTNKTGAISQWTNDSNYLTSVPAQTFASLTSKPTTLAGYGITDGDPVTAGTGIQINSGVVSLDSALSGLSNVSSTAPSSGQVLKWSGSEWAPGTDLASGTAAMNDLTDVSTSGITSGQVLSWNGSSFVATTVSSGGASAIDDLSDVDTTTSAPSNGDVLTWVQADSEWAPAAPSGGGGGSGATIEYFKLNYATNGNLTSVTNTTSGITATITSATGGTVDIEFSSTNYPPANMLMYGYAYSANKYVVKPVSGDMSTKEVTGGGSSGSPIAFGSMGSVKLTLKLREADTGASRSFGTTTHAWLMFTTV
jgi:hypothetical protein